MRIFSVVSLIVLAIGLAGCSGDKKQFGDGPTITDGRAAARGTDEEIVVANDLDWSFITPDAFGAIVLFPQDMLSRDWAKSEVVQEALTDLASGIGVDLNKCKQVTISLTPPQDQLDVPFTVRMEFMEPVDLEAIAAQHSDSLERIEDGDAVYYSQIDAPLSYFAASEDVIYVGLLERLKSIQQGPAPTGTLTKTLKGLEISGQMTAVVDFTPIRPVLLQSLEGMPAGPEGDAAGNRELIESVELIQLTLDMDQEESVVGSIDVGDDDLAQQLAGDLKKQMGQLKLMAPLMLSAALSSFPEDVNTSINVLLFGILSGTKFSHDEGSVVAKLKMPEGSGEQIAVLLNYAAVMQREAEHVANLETVGAALVAAMGEANGLPNPEEFPDYFDADGSPKLSWRVHLLPSLGLEELHNKFKLDEAWDSEHNRPLLDEIPDVYSFEDSTNTSFLVLAGDGMASPKGLPVALDAITDDASKTVVLVDVGQANPVPWTQPIDVTDVDAETFAGYGKADGDIVLVVDAEGMLRQLKKQLTSDQLSGLLSIAGEEEIDDSVFLEMPGFGPGGPGGMIGPGAGGAPPGFGF